MMINSHNDYIEALELERQKVQVFQRELPLCLQLVTQAIETCKQQLSGSNGQLLDECCEQTSSPVFEEFIPTKRALSSHCDDEEQESKKAKNNNNNNNSKRSDWLRSVQLWNQTPDPPSTKDSPKKSNLLEVKRNGAFHPFKKEKIVATPPENGSAPPPSTSSTAETGGGGTNKKGGHSQRNNNKRRRRCWSPELHTRFLQALQQLGGSHVATPKQIRELMKVDGLTNDEVKSHLQKYRLHNTRRPINSSTQDEDNNNIKARQFVVMGGIWVPPEYSTVAAAAAATTKAKAVGGGASPKGIYAPVASLPPPFQETSSSPKQRRSNSDDDSDLGDDDQSYSPATSSSSGHKTNVSPVC